MKVVIDNTVNSDTVALIEKYCKPKGMMKPVNVTLLYFDFDELINLINNMNYMSLDELGFIIVEDYMVLLPKSETTHKQLYFNK